MHEKKELTNVNLLVLKYYNQAYKENNEAQKYVQSRISIEIINKFYIGYAPDNDDLINYLIQKNISIEMLQYLGFINNILDRNILFVDRIMIPIINYHNVIGFCGRTLKNSEIKYLNSKNSIIFNKSKILYPLDFIYKSIVDEGCVIIVEGYFDALALISHGIYNVLSIGGTYFTENHAQIIKRWTNTVYICFDGDVAGITKASKAKDILSKYNIISKIIQLTCDPDEYVIYNGRNKLLNLFSQ